MAGRVWGVGGCRQAWCFREKRARKRRARGTDSEMRALRSVRISRSSGEFKGGSVVVAEGAIIQFLNWDEWLRLRL